MKLKKLIPFTSCLVTTLCATMFSSSLVSANTTHLDTQSIQPEYNRGHIIRKENISYTYEWSSYKRVSSNIQTGPKGGSIHSSKSESFQWSISGNVQGLNIGHNRTFSSTIGYTLHVGANTRAYMGYQVKYKVERGTRYHKNIATQKITRTPYVVKIPVLDEYGLVRY